MAEKVDGARGCTRPIPLLHLSLARGEDFACSHSPACHGEQSRKLGLQKVAKQAPPHCTDKGRTRARCNEGCIGHPCVQDKSVL